VTAQIHELIYYPSAIESHRIRLGLGLKQVNIKQSSIAYDDDAIFFDLGIARKAPVLKAIDGELYTDGQEILWRFDELFPSEVKLVEGVIDQAAWQALLTWRQKVDDELQRLYAPVLLAYDDIGRDERFVKDYKAMVKRHFGISTEALANARYDLFNNLAVKTRLQDLATHLAKNRFYMGQPSIADCLITADLFPLQLMDGVSLPVDLLYYFKRVSEVAEVSLAENLLVTIE